METLIAASRNAAAIRSPLVRHPRMTTQMAERLYVWVGQSLRSAIVSRFRVDAEALDSAIAKAVQTAHQPPQQPPHSQPAPVVSGSDAERREMERRLAAKLKESGQLRPGYLVRALRDQRLGLFTAALAELTGADIALVDRALSSSRPELLALACTAAGVDRGAFPTVLQLVRDLNRSLPGGSSEDARRALTAFGHDRTLALSAFRQMAVQLQPAI
jgi:hypothetical protein